jgi:hypothetical protein
MARMGEGDGTSGHSKEERILRLVVCVLTHTLKRCATQKPDGSLLAVNCANERDPALSGAALTAKLRWLSTCW